MRKIIPTVFFVAATLTGMAASVVKNAVTVSAAKGTSITKAQLMADMNLHLTGDFDEYTIQSFEFAYLPKGGNVQDMYVVNGSSLAGGELEKTIKNMKEGDRLYFENITLASADGKIIQTNAAIEIK